MEDDAVGRKGRARKEALVGVRVSVAAGVDIHTYV
jgi:hypothetical protein